MASVSGRDLAVFIGLSSILCVVVLRPDPEYLFVWVLRGLLALAFAALAAHGINSVWSRLQPKVSPDPGCGLSEEEVLTRQNEARKEKQEKYSEKATEYFENVTKPKLDAKFRQKEEKFYKQMGQEWKLTKGEVLSPPDEEDDGDAERSSPRRRRPPQGSGKEAAESRQLPDHVMNPPKPPPAPEKPQKRKITMPVEPEEGAEGCVNVCLRTSQGRNHRRRFLTSQTIQDLLDFMTMVGYHQNIYQICTSYPRACISGDVDKSLSDVGITRDMALNVEEKEDTASAL